jgi:hypothetical protein
MMGVPVLSDVMIVELNLLVKYFGLAKDGTRAYSVFIKPAFHNGGVITSQTRHLTHQSVGDDPVEGLER